ncbi:MAG: hypothetical protein ABEH90_03180 [Halolamina sp.]
MFELPADSPALWVGLAVTAAAFLAVAGSLPTSPPPDAASVAGTVDGVAAGDAPAMASHRHAADAVRLDPHGLAMRNNAGTARATFAFGPITPVVGDGPLRAVLDGEHPADVFDDPTEFRQTVVEARSEQPRWVTSSTVEVTGVSWNGYRVTLVGA